MPKPKHDGTKPVPATRRLVTIADLVLSNPEAVKPVYANNAAVSRTPHDFRVVFSEVVVGNTTNEEPRLELRANIAMSHTHFKALAIAMNHTLAMYEAESGKIAWPPKEKEQSQKMQ